MSDVKTRVNFDEVSKLMSVATAIVNEWPTNTGILSLVQARLKEIEAQAKAEVKEQSLERASIPGGMPADTVTHRGPTEESFPAEDEDGDGDIDEDDVQTDPARIARNPDGSPIDGDKPVVRRAAPTAADAARTGGRRV